MSWMSILAEKNKKTPKKTQQPTENRKNTK